ADVGLGPALALRKDATLEDDRLGRRGQTRREEATQEQPHRHQEPGAQTGREHPHVLAQDLAQPALPTSEIARILPIAGKPCQNGLRACPGLFLVRHGAHTRSAGDRSRALRVWAPCRTRNRPGIARPDLKRVEEARHRPKPAPPIPIATPILEPYSSSSSGL